MKKVLLIGVGNTLRGDDGAGAFVCDAIEHLNLNQVIITKAHQLQTELLEEMMACNRILIIDAAIGINNVTIEKVTEGSRGVSSSHHTDIAVFRQLACRLYNKDINIYICAIPAFNFELGEGLTKETKIFAEQAVEKTLQWMKC